MYIAQNVVLGSLVTFQDLLQFTLGDLKSEDNRMKILRMAWVVAVVLVIVLTLIALLFLPLRWGIGISTGVWAVFLGGTAIVFLRPKTITAAFGGLFGLGSSDAATGSGLMTTISTEISKVVIQVPSGDFNTEFVSMMVWLFFAIVTVLTIPAFFAEK